MIAIMFDGFASESRVLRFGPNETVFRRGEPVVAVYQVVSGRVAMVRTLESGEQAIIARADAGGTFAEAALFSDIYHCDAVALSACELRAFPVAALRERLGRDQAAGVSLAKFFARQVRDLRARVELLRIKRADDRVLAWLQLQAKGAPPRVERAAPWSDIATEIGMTPEAFYRAMGSLRRSGRIARAGRGVELRA